MTRSIWRGGLLMAAVLMGGNPVRAEAPLPARSFPATAPLPMPVMQPSKPLRAAMMTMQTSVETAQIKVTPGGDPATVWVDYNHTTALSFFDADGNPVEIIGAMSGNPRDFDVAVAHTAARNSLAIRVSHQSSTPWGDVMVYLRGATMPVDVTFDAITSGAMANDVHPRPAPAVPTVAGNGE